MTIQMNQQLLMSMPSGGVVALELPPADAEVVDGVRWGQFDVLFTPAFWAGRAWIATLDGTPRNHRLGRTLREEIAACLLGGFGIPAEVGLAAFHRVREAGLLEGQPSSVALQALLREPLQVGDRLVRYRFANQKARFLGDALNLVDDLRNSADDVAFRDALAELPGIGLKTASWITRNMRDSDSIAILDIHICRACLIAGVFSSGLKGPTSYRLLEQRYLAFASGLGVRASLLDAIMWENMRRLAGWLPPH